MSSRGGRSVAESSSTHKSIEESVEFVNLKIKKHEKVIQFHTDKLKYYRQIKDTLDGEIRWRENNRLDWSRIEGNIATSSSRRVSSKTESSKASKASEASKPRKKPLGVEPLLQPVKEGVSEEGEPVPEGVPSVGELMRGMMTRALNKSVTPDK